MPGPPRTHWAPLWQKLFPTKASERSHQSASMPMHLRPSRHGRDRGLTCGSGTEVSVQSLTEMLGFTRSTAPACSFLLPRSKMSGCWTKVSFFIGKTLNFACDSGRKVGELPPLRIRASSTKSTPVPEETGLFSIVIKPRPACACYVCIRQYPIWPSSSPWQYEFRGEY